jgi:hypothetical protein
MTSRDLVYWLQGLMELGDPKTLNEKQVDLIKKHLRMVFIHEIDPSFPEEHQAVLNKAHESSVEELIEKGYEPFSPEVKEELKKNLGELAKPWPKPKRDDKIRC